jgi:hypothetical protein
VEKCKVTYHIIFIFMRRDNLLILYHPVLSSSLNPKKCRRKRERESPQNLDYVLVIPIQRSEQLSLWKDGFGRGRVTREAPSPLQKKLFEEKVGWGKWRREKSSWRLAVLTPTRPAPPNTTTLGPEALRSHTHTILPPSYP